MKPGIQTTEFWLAIIMNLVSAVLGILVAYGLITDEEVGAWETLAKALVLVVLPVVQAVVNRTYIIGRTELKSHWQ